MGDLEPLSNILKGSSDPSSPRHLTDAARQVLAQADYTIQNHHVHYINYDQPWQAYIFAYKAYSYGSIIAKKVLFCGYIFLFHQ